MLTKDLFAARLKELRMERNLTQRQLAEMMMVSNGTVGNWESGIRLPDITMLTRLAECLGVEPYVIMDLFHEADKPVNVIIVEDVPVILRGSLRMLEEAMPRADILGFNTSSSALDFAHSNRVFIAFLDIELDGEDGLRLGRKLTAINPRTNIIYLTCHTEYMDIALYDHCSGYITKPLTPERIRHELSNLRYPVRGLEL